MSRISSGSFANRFESSSSGTSTDNRTFTSGSTGTSTNDSEASLISQLISHIDLTNLANENEINSLKDSFSLLRSGVAEYKNNTDGAIQNLTNTTNASITALTQRTTTDITTVATEASNSIDNLTTQTNTVKDLVQQEKESLLRWIFGIAAAAIVLFLASAAWVIVYFDDKYTDLNQKNDTFISDVARIQSDLSDINDNKSDIVTLKKQFRSLESRQYSQDWKLKVIEGTNGKILTELSKNSRD